MPVYIIAGILKTTTQLKKVILCLHLQSVTDATFRRLKQ